MSKIIQVQRTLGSKLAELLKRKPQNFDVIFSVGPDKIKVEAVKIILKAVSPVFEQEFEEKWDNAIVKEGEGIPLPDVDPTAFELFVNLINSDSWSVEALKRLYLPPNTLLNLLGLCRRYEITDAIKSLEEAARNFIQSFCNFKDTEEFLKMSRENLESVFHFEEIPLDEKEIFECACRWAEFHCKENKMELTGENLRKVLGDCLFQVRFPTMKLQDFTQVSLHQPNILPDDVKLAIYDFIGMGEGEKAKYDNTKLPYKTIPRVKSIPFGCTVLRLPSEQFTATTNPPFLCNGSTTSNQIRVTQKIELHGIGFLGPIEKDSHFDVRVKINAYDEVYNYNYDEFDDDGVRVPNTMDNAMQKKNIFARKGKTFHFLFDEPIIIEPSGSCSYNIKYSLTGATSVSRYVWNGFAWNLLQVPGVQVDSPIGWGNKPLAELLYKIIYRKCYLYACNLKENCCNTVIYGDWIILLLHNCSSTLILKCRSHENNS